MLREIKSFQTLFSHYTELRVQENRVSSLSLLNGDMVNNSSSANKGISARVFDRGGWGFASQANIDDKTIKTVIQDATLNAQYLGSKHQKTLVLPSKPGTSENAFFTTNKHLTDKEKIAFLKEMDAYIKTKYPSLTSRAVSNQILEMEKKVLTSDNGDFYSMIPRAMIAVSLTVTKDNMPYSLWKLFGGFGQMEDLFDEPQKLYAEIDETYEHLVKKAEGIYPAGGMADVILDADLAGILSHEAIGHTTEADLVLGGSVAGDCLNEMVATPLVTLTDFASHAFGKMCPVPVFVDDEGTKAEDAVIIEKGMLKSFMHNRESAEHFGVAPTGNARAYQFSDEPLIRMRNTAITPGTSKLNEMISSIDNGYYLMQSSNGQADSTGEFMFGVVQGYEITNGKLGKALKDTTISGVAFDVLKTVSMISDDVKWSCFGMCGKKQSIPVGMGGPAIKCRVNIGGRA
jgi:TldD protein